MTIDKLAKGLNTSAVWLGYGVGKDVSSKCSYLEDSGRLSIDVGLLCQALHFVLELEGVVDHRAALISSIILESLIGPPIDAVGGDPLMSFRIYFQLATYKSEIPTKRHK